MNFRHLALATALTALLSVPSFAADTCAATSAQRSDFVGKQIMSALDRGRDKSGALPGWVEAYVKDPEAHGDALARYCDLYPAASLRHALERAFATSKTASVN